MPLAGDYHPGCRLFPKIALIFRMSSFGERSKA
jgi:hypothetical protein